MSRYLISVVIPLYNKRSYISRSIDSVLNQNDCDVEIIVVDDGSTDGSADLVAKIACENSNIRLIKKGNGGAASARNVGVRAAHGEYVAFLDADDELKIGAISTYRKMIDKFPYAGAFGINFSFVKNGIEFRKHQPELLNGLAIQRVDYFEGISKGGWYLTSSSTCAKRSMLIDVGLFDEKLVQREDPHMWYRLALVSPVIFCKDVYALYHLDPDQRVCTIHKAVSEFADNLLLMQYIDDGLLSASQTVAAKKIISSGYVAQATQNLQVENLEEAKRAMSKASLLFSSNRYHYCVVYFLCHTGTWRLINPILKLRKQIIGLSNKEI